MAWICFRKPLRPGDKVGLANSCAAATEAVGQLAQLIENSGDLEEPPILPSPLEPATAMVIEKVVAAQLPGEGCSEGGFGKARPFGRAAFMVAGIAQDSALAGKSASVEASASSAPAAKVMWTSARLRLLNCAGLSVEPNA